MSRIRGGEPGDGALPAWALPLHRSRTGAAHRRRQTACQDCSLTAHATSADGLPVQLMAVADGHGGQRYWLSEVGSALACRLAIETAAGDLADLHLQPEQAVDRERLQAWLGRELPQRIVAQWQTAVASHWQSHTATMAIDGTFSPFTYGTTLGLVVLTPRWWAHTGLGDWDLVLVEGNGQARIISEETAPAGTGEGTASLCLPEAATLFASRTGIHTSGEPDRPLALVLSTDGVRKSCATDGDHLRLCAYLAGEAATLAAGGEHGETSRLDACLDRISREGSGDDVSVAFGLWTAQPAWRGSPARTLETPPPRPSPPSAATLPGRRVLLFAAAGLLLAGGLALKPWRWMSSRTPLQARQPPTRQTPAPAATDPEVLNREATRLCRRPELIRPTLNQRKALFRRLLAGEEAAAAIVRGGDATGALIAASRPGGTGLGSAPTCPALLLELQQHWQSAKTSP